MTEPSMVFNRTGTQNTDTGLASDGDLASAKEDFVAIASAPTMFGDVPGGHLAQEALATTAFALLNELEDAEITVHDIQRDARTMTGIADAVDEETGGSVRGTEYQIGAFLEEMDRRRSSLPDNVREW